MLSKVAAILCVFVLILQCTAIAGLKDYKDYRIYNVVAHTAEQQQFLRQLSKDRSYDFLQLSRHPNRPNRVLVAPATAERFVTLLNERRIEHTLVVADVSLVLEQEHSENAARPLVQARLNVFEQYYRHDEINAHLQQLAQSYPARVFVKTFGRSHERRPLQIVTITNGDGRAGKKVIFIDAAMHAREWITPAMALHIVGELVENYAANAELLADYDWVVMPVVNADGYEYTHTEDRYWRKTRRPSQLSPGSGCVGADPNRNFDFMWGGEEGASSDPCDDTYRGDWAFAESEAIVVRDIMLHYGERAKFYLSLHSYGNLILLPWGHTPVLPDNYFDMMEVADAGAMAIVQATDTSYTYGNTYDVIYPTTGDSMDYAAGVVHIPVTLAMELPAGGPSGFDPPVRQIEDLVTETWIGIRAMAAAVVASY